MESKQEQKEVIPNSWMIVFGGYNVEEMLNLENAINRTSHATAEERKQNKLVQSNAARKRCNFRGHSSKPLRVIQLDKYGNQLAEYRSIMAASKANKMDASSIRHICHGTRTNIRGMIFKFKESSDG